MSPEIRERLDELLADRALVGLSASEELALERLLDEAGETLDLGLELAAAELHLALTRSAARAREAEPLPAPLRRQLDASSRDFLRPARLPAPRSATPGPRPAPARRSGVLALTGWLVAAAAGLLAVLLWRTRSAGGAPALDPAAERSALLARADSLRLDWSPTDPGASAGGDVTWSQALQAGVMRIRGLTANDPGREQFQLWIFDKSQEHPIDGGVFDVAGDEVLIPIEAKLRVQEPTLFAITVEKPGGVVVSDQKRIVLVAKI